MKIGENQIRYIRIITVAKFHSLAFFLTVILNLSCSDPSPNSQHQKEIKNSSPQKAKPSSSYSDTIKIKPLAAVFFSPDSMQLEKIKAITDPMVFESQTHEFFYQMRNSRIVIKKYYPHVKIIEIKNYRYLFFMNQDGTEEYYDLNTQNDPWGILLFDGQKAPRLVDMTNIDTELGFYFSKK